MIGQAPIKTRERMIEKRGEYAAAAAASGKTATGWPFAACILDPVRVSIVCQGPAQMLEVSRWLLQDGMVGDGHICRVKNKFGLPEDSETAAGGYRDLQLCVVFRFQSV